MCTSVRSVVFISVNLQINKIIYTRACVRRSFDLTGLAARPLARILQN